MKRQVLLASVGLSLPVVTETLWALMNPSRRSDIPAPVFPDLVHVITTAPPVSSNRQDDLDRRGALLRDRVSALYDQHGRKAPDFVFEGVPDPLAPDGCPLLADVRDARENILYANHVTRVVRGYCADPDTVLHMSLAGGRKTMSSYDHSAMMFFGRAQDELSHVLVTPPVLERAGERFWWPGQPEASIRVGDCDVPTTTADAGVELVPVPYVRLGVRLPSGVPPEAEDYRELLDFIAFERAGGVFEIDADSLSIRWGQRQVKLTKTYFALFAVFAIARKVGWPGFGSAEEGSGANTAGFFLLNDLRAGLRGSAKDHEQNLTPAWRCLQALLQDERFHHGLEGASLIDKIARSRLDPSGRVVREGRTVDESKTYRSNLARQLKQKLRCPYTLRLLTPAQWKTEDGRIVIGLPISPERLRLSGFSPYQLNQHKGSA